jgi:uncharacterized membrane protein
MEQKRTGKPRKSSPWADTLSPGRIEALCDGVFAIAMTILVLELSIPNLIGTHAASEDIPRSFIEILPEFYVYAMGFIVLGVYWILHHFMFHFIRRSDGVLVWLNILFLMSAALVPFLSAVLRVNKSLAPGTLAPTQMPWVFYAGSTVGTILILLGIWQYATGKHRLVDPDIDKRVISAFKKVILIPVTIMIVGFVLSFFIPLGSLLSTAALVFIIVITARARHGIFS